MSRRPPPPPRDRPGRGSAEEVAGVRDKAFDYLAQHVVNVKHRGEQLGVGF